MKKGDIKAIWMLVVRDVACSICIVAMVFAFAGLVEYFLNFF